eukprot:357693-Chlamydomonas_euryale.AAC.1
MPTGWGHAQGAAMPPVPCLDNRPVQLTQPSRTPNADTLSISLSLPQSILVQLCFRPVNCQNWLPQPEMAGPMPTRRHAGDCMPAGCPRAATLATACLQDAHEIPCAHKSRSYAPRQMAGPLSNGRRDGCLCCGASHAHPMQLPSRRSSSYPSGAHARRCPTRHTSASP